MLIESLSFLSYTESLAVLFYTTLLATPRGWDAVRVSLKPWNHPETGQTWLLRSIGMLILPWPCFWMVSGLVSMSCSSHILEQGRPLGKLDSLWKGKGRETLHCCPPYVEQALMLDIVSNPWHYEISKTDWSFTGLRIVPSKLISAYAQLSKMVTNDQFVTSSSTTIGGIIGGLALNPKNLTETIGVVKSYTTRVGAGSFKTELHDECVKVLLRYRRQANKGQVRHQTPGNWPRMGQYHISKVFNLW